MCKFLQVLQFLCSSAHLCQPENVTNCSGIQPNAYASHAGIHIWRHIIIQFVILGKTVSLTPPWMTILLQKVSLESEEGRYPLLFYLHNNFHINPAISNDIS